MAVAAHKSTGEIGSGGDGKAHPARSGKKNRAATVPKLPHARRAPMPGFTRPQLATLVKGVPPGDEWLHEIKFDGYRALCRIEKGRAIFFTREGLDWTYRFQSLADAGSKLPVEKAFLDGEVVVMNADGSTDFQALQNALSKNEKDRLVYFAFDLTYLEGYDLTRTPLLDRKKALAGILQSAGSEKIRLSEHIIGRGESFYQNACQLGLEGVISKRKEAPYRSGRSRDWLKVKCFKSQEFVIGGFTDPSGSRAGLGALLVGLYNETGDLVFTGRVGTGFTGQSLLELRGRLDQIAQKSPPFSNPPTGADARGVHWVKPELVAEVAFAGWTRDGFLRHPSFKGLREDKPVSKVVKESPLPIDRATRVRKGGNPAVVLRPASPAQDDPEQGPTARGRGPRRRVEIAGIRLTHPGRVLYPEQGITKQKLALFYEEIAEWIIPHLSGRPLSVVRCPEGRGKECFYQRHAREPLHDSVRRLRIREKKSFGTYLMVDSLPGLIALVQMGALEFHTWGCRNDLLDRPDRLIFDLDPDPSVAWPRVIEAAKELRGRLSGVGLASFVKTTGGKGLHVVVPLARKQNWEEAKDFSQAVAQALVREAPDRYIATMSKLKRRGKIFVDYLRNGWGATAVAAYSTRARPGAPVSVPLRWEELAPDLRSDHFTVANLAQRLSVLKKDPWEGYEAARRPITAAMKRSLGFK